MDIKVTPSDARYHYETGPAKNHLSWSRRAGDNLNTFLFFLTFVVFKLGSN